MFVIGFSVEVVEWLIFCMIFGIGFDDEDCDGIFDFFENDGNDVQDICFYLIIDWNYFDVDGDLVLFDEFFDNVVGMFVDCIFVDNNGLCNYGCYCYIQIVCVYNVIDFSIVVEDYGGFIFFVLDLFLG